MYKVVNGMSPEIRNEVLKPGNNSHYNLRHISQFSVNPSHRVYNGTESASYLELKIWKQITSKFEIGNLSIRLSGRSRIGNRLTALEEFIKSSYQT